MSKLKDLPDFDTMIDDALNEKDETIAELVNQIMVLTERLKLSDPNYSEECKQKLLTILKGNDKV